MPPYPKLLAERSPPVRGFRFLAPLCFGRPVWATRSGRLTLARQKIICRQTTARHHRDRLREEVQFSMTSDPPDLNTQPPAPDQRDPAHGSGAGSSQTEASEAGPTQAGPTQAAPVPEDTGHAEATGHDGHQDGSPQETGQDPAVEDPSANSGAEAPLQETQAQDAQSVPEPSAAAPSGEASPEPAVEKSSDPASITFDDLGLSEKVLRAVKEAGYTSPTPIQAQAIPIALQGRDILGLAQTGTGKTASFTLPMIDLLSKGRGRARMPRSLILAPTRELAMQVAENFEKYGKYHRLTMALLIGGVSFNEQNQKLDRGVDVLIATPGRLIDHTERGKVLLTGVQVLVVDEADRMLDMGFIPDIERIVKLTPFTRQTLLFSATMPKEIEDLAAKFLQNPERVEVAKRSSAAETVTQAVCTVRTEDKREALRQLIRMSEIQNAIIFCNRKRDVTVVFRSLTKHGFNVAALHGDLDQSVRMQVLDQFRKGNIHLLVASDVAARGLDIPEVSHVFNFDVPFNSEDYVHRIGRTGRAGRSGAAYMIATRSDTKYLDAITKMIGKDIPPLELDGLSPEGGEEDQGGRGRNASRDGAKDGARDGDSSRRGRGRGGRSRRRDGESGSDGDERQARSGNRRNDQRSDDQRSEDQRGSGGRQRSDDRSRDDRSRDDRSRDDRSRDDRGRDGRDDRSRAERSQRNDDRSNDRQNDRSRGRRGRRRYDDDDDTPVIGLGDHVPAFLLRPVRVSKSTTEEPEDNGADDGKSKGNSGSDDYPVARTG